MSVIQPFGWTFRTLQDAYNPRPPIRWAVTGLLQIPSLSIVYGSPGSFKSMLLADMAACVAAGLPWLDAMPHTTNRVRGLPTQPGPVLWLDFDNGERRTDDRFDAIGKARQLDPSIPLRYVAMPSGWLFMDKRQHAEALAATILQQGAHMAVIDNLGVISGGADENTAQMAPVMANLRYVCEWSNSALVVIHHQRKGNGSKGREGETLRGHSSIEAALDLALLIEREKNSAEIRLRSTKTRGADVQERGALFTYQHKPGTLELAQARFYGCDIDEPNPNADIEDAILDLLRQSSAPMNQTEIIKALVAQEPAWTRRKVRPVIVDMENKALLTVTTGPKQSKVYGV